MSYGFLALNNNNQVLVSSDTRNLHFIQKLSSPAEGIYGTDDYGGIRQWRYRATCNAIPLPFFTMPTEDSYGLARITDAGGGQWDIEVLRTGTSGSYPEVYIFAEPSATSSSDGYGMLVYADDGITPVFDSRLKPLVVVGGLTVSQTSAVRYNAPPYALNSDHCQSGSATSGGIFTPEGINTYSAAGINSISKPIYSYNSIAQAQIMYSFSRSQRDCAGFDVYGGCLGYQTEEFWDSYYWCFYRGGIQIIHSNETLNATWMPTRFNCYWNYREDSSFFGIGTGGGGGADGTWPYNNETLNLSGNTVIVANGARYD